MSSYSDSIRREVVDRLVDYVVEHLPQDEVPLIKNFILQYYLTVSPEDLSSKSILDLYGAVLSHWHFITQRKPGEAKVRVYNPHLEQHGWQSTHTIVEIAFDDMPFLVDSVTMELNRLELNIHLIIHMGNIRLQRDNDGRVINVLEKDAKTDNSIPEAVIYVEIDKQSDPEVLDMIAENIQRVLYDVRDAVVDWPRMRSCVREILKELIKHHPAIDEELFKESERFLEWIIDDHFTFLGYEEREVVASRNSDDGNAIGFRKIRGESLGLCKTMGNGPKVRYITELPPDAQALILSKEPLMIGKSRHRSTIHRPAYMDFIVIKKWDEAGNLIKLHQFMGLFTSVVYNNSPLQIPLLRLKVKAVLNRAGYVPRSHDDRALLNILETLPRDDLLQATVEELMVLSTGILHLQERQKIRLFIRRDTFGYFFSCLVFVPRDTYNSQLREKMQEILMRGLKGMEVTFSTRFSESSLARIHFVIRVDPREPIEYKLKDLEQQLIDTGRTWKDEFRVALGIHFGEEQGNEFFKRYGNAFPVSYQEAFAAPLAVMDIEHFEELSSERSLAMSLYRVPEDPENEIRFKLFRMNDTIPLSDVVPILEKMGLRIISERPYEITPRTGNTIWINDYRMMYSRGHFFEIETVRDIFQEAFDDIWKGNSENDGFNRLVLASNLNSREVALLRAYAKYLWQAGFSFSQSSIEDALFTNAHITVDLLRLFKLRFNPERTTDEVDIEMLQQKIGDALENVSNLNEDRILRRYLHVITATLRTNYYQKTKEGIFKSYLSFKLDSAKVPELPLPVPLYEIFVYSPRVEAIHLRGAKVARGGIRWSDRRDDFRTEILGLLKAQQVKNAVIVPMGAKGGFVVKQSPEQGTRDQIMEEVINCYKTFMCGLLDITDNLKDNQVIVPENVVRYDGDDPYLVVAADKGTASFSDIANAISKDYHFWLGDAFASGGSTGYDHKKMGITARGVWESVKRHFHELDIDFQTKDFTVFGIGDMAGDVFGNGMLLSKHIKLVAAFNHMHIFLDPNPDSELSFNERKRLFELPRSTWADYNPALLSQGGGIFLRSAKSVTLTPEVKEILKVEADKLTPNELIRAILKAPVDLFWNGGIGTYVKSTRETNAEVGDRSNDSVRINGIELRCRVVGEGGNLGLTQLGRVEYALNGGQLNTDAIDNSGGVNCSDNEVNIKILLNDVVEKGDLTEKQRNDLLIEMQHEVAELVLFNNRRQTEAISVAVSQAPSNIELHGRVISEMVREGILDRALEFLPDKEEIAERKAEHIGLTRPEIAVLMAYSKTSLKNALINSTVPEDPYIVRDLALSFPQAIDQRFPQYLEHHRLKREIIVTRLSNAVINEMGISFVYRLEDETGALHADIIRAFVISRAIFEVHTFHTAVTALTGRVASDVQLRMLQEVNRLVRRGTRWFLRNRPPSLNIEETIQQFSENISRISDELPFLLLSSGGEMEMAKSLIELSVPEPLAVRVGCLSAMFSSLDVAEAATIYKIPIDQVAAVYYALGTRLHLGWFREIIKLQPIKNHWEALARATFRDDIDRQQRNLTIAVLQKNENGSKDTDAMINHWIKRHKTLVKRWEYFVNELKNTQDVDFTMFSVALRELLNMSQTIGLKGKNY